AAGTPARPGARAAGRGRAGGEPARRAALLRAGSARAGGVRGADRRPPGCGGRKDAGLMYLQDKGIVVSGVGPDLGREIAVRGAAAGADVVLAARTVSRLEEVAAEIKELGRRALVVPFDMTIPDDAARLAEASVAEFGKVDALVHNALVMP